MLSAAQWVRNQNGMSETRPNNISMSPKRMNAASMPRQLSTGLSVPPKVLPAIPMPPPKSVVKILDEAEGGGKKDVEYLEIAVHTVS